MRFVLEFTSCAMAVHAVRAIRSVSLSERLLVMHAVREVAELSVRVSAFRIYRGQNYNETIRYRELR